MKAKLSRQPAEPWYRQIVGDAAFAEIMRLGGQVRCDKLKT